jgi:recombination protein RecA
MAQGRENAKQFLREHPDLAVQVETAVRQHLQLGGAPLPVESVDGDENLEQAKDPAELELILEGAPS